MKEINIIELLNLINNIGSNDNQFRIYPDGSGGIYKNDDTVVFAWEDNKHMQEVLNDVYYDYLNDIRPKIKFNV